LRSLDRRRATGLACVALIVALALSPPARALWSLPGEVHIACGRAARLNVDIPLWLAVRQSRSGVVALGGAAGGVAADAGRWQRVAGDTLALRGVQEGDVDLYFRILGLLPVRRVRVSVLPAVAVVPGGHSIGVLLRTAGLVVVGFAAVAAGDDAVSPARDAGVARGDLILAADGHDIETDSELTAAVDAAGRAGRAVVIEVRRGERKLALPVTPRLDGASGAYRIGVYVRDGRAGVGTLTFFDPGTGRYMALGHVVAEGKGETPLDVRQGQIVRAVVSGVRSAQRGQPGEKIGVFVEPQQVVGTIEQNTPFGIVGTLRQNLSNPYYGQTVSIAAAGEVHEGAAEIMTVVDGLRVERFAVRIVRVFPQSLPSAKGMIVRITDQRLLGRTGGIVQGMSGSPIMQDGSLVGAVTHVFVNDPARGYGVFGEWMAMASGLYGELRTRTAGAVVGAGAAAGAAAGSGVPAVRAA